MAIVKRVGLRGAVAALVITILAGCSLLGSEAKDPASKHLATIKVAVQPITDLAPFHIARLNGYFKREGLDVEYVMVASGGDAMTKLVAGEVDVSYAGYTTMFTAESKNLFKVRGGLKIVADASSASPESTVIMATRSSPVKNIKDLPGKRLAINEMNGTSHLLVLSALSVYNVPADKIKWAATPFPATAQALKSGRIDAAFATEPFIQDAMRNAGASPIVDLATGPAVDLPLAGYATTADYAKANPKPVAGFQRAMQRATTHALENRPLVNRMLVKYSHVDKSTAEAATLLRFRSKLVASRIQRPADMMMEFKFIKRRVDVKNAIIPSAPLS